MTIATEELYSGFPSGTPTEHQMLELSEKQVREDFQAGIYTSYLAALDQLANSGEELGYEVRELAKSELPVIAGRLGLHGNEEDSKTLEDGRTADNYYLFKFNPGKHCFYRQTVIKVGRFTRDGEAIELNDNFFTPEQAELVFRHAEEVEAIGMTPSRYMRAYHPYS